MKKAFAILSIAVLTFFSVSACAAEQQLKPNASSPETASPSVVENVGGASEGEEERSDETTSAAASDTVSDPDTDDNWSPRV